MTAAPVTRLETRTERLWRDFVEARDRAIQSGDLRDGIAAGHAFARFVQEFLPPDLRERMQ